jgi:RNA polymerase sigma-70 factor, ECF subfamily
MVTDVSDESLARRAQRGDSDAFLTLYRRYLDRVYRRVRSKVPTADVEDVTQDIFLAVVRSLDRYEQRSRFNTWLYTIVNRQIAEYYRRRNRRADDEAIEIDVIGYLLVAPENENADQYAAIRRAFLTLPGHYQEIILARFSDGLTFAEIAAERGQSLEAVKSLYRRAIQALRDYITGG